MQGEDEQGRSSQRAEIKIETPWESKSDRKSVVIDVYREEIDTERNMAVSKVKLSANPAVWPRVKNWNLSLFHFGFRVLWFLVYLE